MHAQTSIDLHYTKKGAARLRNLLLCKTFLLQSKRSLRPAAPVFFNPAHQALLQGHHFSCSASGTRSLDFRRFARRRCALQAIACSHLLKTPRYLLGHT